MKSILKIDLNTNTKIVLAVLRVSNTVVNHSTVALLNTKVYIAF